MSNFSEAYQLDQKSSLEGSLEIFLKLYTYKKTKQNKTKKKKKAKQNKNQKQKTIQSSEILHWFLSWISTKKGKYFFPPHFF